MDEANQGLMTSYWNGIFDPDAPWPRVTARDDHRLFPIRGGGRRMRHPYYDPIAYPTVPDQTTGFGYDRLRAANSVMMKTITSSAVAKFPDAAEDVVIKEIWLAKTASTITKLFHQFHRYLIDPLPPNRFIGWQPRDLTSKNYFIDLLDVSCGPSGEYLIEEIGDYRPWMMREALTVEFKLVKELGYPAGVSSMVGV